MNLAFLELSENRSGARKKNNNNNYNINNKKKNQNGLFTKAQSLLQELAVRLLLCWFSSQPEAAAQTAVPVFSQQEHRGAALQP